MKSVLMLSQRYLDAGSGCSNPTGTLRTVLNLVDGVNVTPNPCQILMDCVDGPGGVLGEHPSTGEAASLSTLFAPAMYFMAHVVLMAPKVRVKYC